MPGAALKMDRVVLFVVVAFLVLMASFSDGARAQSPSPASSPPRKAPEAPPPSRKTPSISPPPAEPPEAPHPPKDSCLTAVSKRLLPCIGYVKPESNQEVTTACCDGFKMYLEDQPKCVCFLIDSNAIFPIQVDRGKALKLPSACKVKVPPIDQCFRNGSAVESPASPPENAANPSFVPSATAFLAGISLAVVAAFL